MAEAVKTGADFNRHQCGVQGFQLPDRSRREYMGDVRQAGALEGYEVVSSAYSEQGGFHSVLQV